MEIKEIFSNEELEYISKKRPDLIPLRVPSISEYTLKKPSLDQIIVKFLKKYEVNIEPRTVGKWNGWDTLTLLSRSDNMSNISSTIFYANRSQQINSVAEEWNTWKRWVLDNKKEEFEEYKDDVLKSIEIQNKKNITNSKVEEKIKQAELNNQLILNALQEPDAIDYVSFLKKRNAVNKLFRIVFICFIPFTLYFISIDCERTLSRPIENIKCSGI